MGFLIGFGLFFLAILFTIIFGGVSKLGDRRVALEGVPRGISACPRSRAPRWCPSPRA